MGTLTLSFFAAATTPLASVSTRRMPPKMLMKMAFTFLSESRISKAFSICCWFAPPPTSRKFAGDAAGVLDDVHGGHGEAGAVHHAGDVAVELDVVERVLGGFDFERVFFGDVAQVLEFLVAEHGVVVEVDLAVEGEQACRPWW